MVVAAAVALAPCRVGGGWLGLTSIVVELCDCSTQPGSDQIHR
jgi:hypothetical protein